NRLTTAWWIAILTVSVCFHYSTYAKYLPAKKAEKADFEQNRVRIAQGKLTDFSFGWPPLDIRRELPRQTLRTADSLGYFSFKFKDEADILDALPSVHDRHTTYRIERFEQVTLVAMTLSGWGLIHGVD